MMPTGSQGRREGYFSMQLKKDARGVHRRLGDDLVTVLTNLAARRPGNRATNNPLSAKLTRGKFLKAMGAGVAWLALTNTPGANGLGACQTCGASARARTSARLPL